MAIPQNISEQHVLEAIKQIDNFGVSNLRQSTKFELLYKGNLYPPKEVIRFANEVANDYELRAFGGGDESNNFLINLGFEIFLKGTNKRIGLNFTKNKGFRNISEDNIIEPEPAILLVEKEIEESIVSVTERDQLIKARIGQSEFKSGLLSRELKCKLCGVKDERFLIASHIKPWSHSNHYERLDLDNGFLLCPNHDALFDKGYITFENDGKLLISSLLDDETKLFLNITENLRIDLNEKQQEYLSWHRESLYKTFISK